jgi:phosphoserine phosphatase
VIGTKFEVENGRYTGRVTVPAIIGVEKERQVRRFFKDRQVEIDWAASYAYADSISDRDLLEMVGHPTVTFPGDELRTLATEQGWKIIDS